MTLRPSPPLRYALIPGGCETEMQGFYEFLGAVLSWAPPLAFIQIKRHAFIIVVGNLTGQQHGLLGNGLQPVFLG